MNWELVSAVCSLLTLVGTLAVVAHSQGKQTQKIADLKEDVADNKEQIEKHTVQLTTHEADIGKLQVAVWPENWHRV